MVRSAAVACMASILGLCAPAWSRTVEGVHLDEKASVLGHELLLNGAALLEATVFKVDVYVAGLYLPARQSNPDAVLKCDGPWQVRMTYLRDIGSKRFRGGWGDALEGRPELRVRGVRQLVGDLLVTLREVRKGDVHTLTFDPSEGFLFAINGKVVFRTKDHTFARLIIRGFVDAAHTPGGIAPYLLGRPAG